MIVLKGGRLVYLLISSDDSLKKQGHSPGCSLGKRKGAIKPLIPGWYDYAVFNSATGLAAASLTAAVYFWYWVRAV